jgi:hypothetical protein
MVGSFLALYLVATAKLFFTARRDNKYDLMHINLRPD